MKVRVVAAVLVVATATAGGLVAWGSGQQIRLDPVTLSAAGVTQSTDELPVQVAQGDLLFRAWDGSARVESTDRITELSPAALVRFDDGDLLLTQDAVAIDTTGTATDVPAREELAVQSDLSYVGADSTVGALDVVRLAQRRYYFAPEATVLVDGAEVGTTSQVQIAIDRSGSATLTGADHVRQRYLGHLQLVVDDTHVLDVSAEVYRADGQEIDLSAFGGSDNEHLVVQDDTTPTAEPSAEATEGPAVDEATGSDDGSTGTTGTGTTGAGSAGTGSTTGSGIDPETLRRFQEIARAIEEINASRATAIPTATLSQISPGATAVTAQVQVADPSGALVGGVEVRVIDPTTGSTVASTTVGAGISSVQLGPLTPGTGYALAISYVYDFGAGEGQQRITADQGYAFTTLPVNALYTISDVKATSARVRVGLDSAVGDLASARLYVDRVGGFLGIGGGRVQEVALSAADLSAGSAGVLIDGLTEQTGYRVQAELTLTDGQVLTLATSPQLVTRAATELSATATVDDLGALAVTYDWWSEDYRVTDVQVELTESRLFGGAVDATVVAADTGTVRLIPESEGSLTATVLITATDAEGVARQFTASAGSVDWQSDWVLDARDREDGGTDLVLTGPASAAGTGAVVRFEQSARVVPEGSGRVWAVLGAADVLADTEVTTGTEHAEQAVGRAVWTVPAEDAPFLANSTLRAVVTLDGQDLTTVDLSDPDAATS